MGQWTRIVSGQVVFSCKCGNEPSGFTNTGNFPTSTSPIRFWCSAMLRGVRKEDKNYLKNLH